MNHRVEPGTCLFFEFDEDKLRLVKANFNNEKTTSKYIPFLGNKDSVPLNSFIGAIDEKLKTIYNLEHNCNLTEQSTLQTDFLFKNYSPQKFFNELI